MKEKKSKRNLFAASKRPPVNFNLPSAAATIRCNVSFVNADGGNVATNKRKLYSSAADDDKGGRQASQAKPKEVKI